jgi:hypothetical protein
MGVGDERRGRGAVDGSPVGRPHLDSNTQGRHR